MKTLRDQPDSGVLIFALQDLRSRKECTPFELVYTDLAGSFKPNAMDGSQYIGKFIDHHTRWKTVYPIRPKDKAIDILSYFIQDYAILLGNENATVKVR